MRSVQANVAEKPAINHVACWKSESIIQLELTLSAKKKKNCRNFKWEKLRQASN
jgi:hypothetical protein